MTLSFFTMNRRHWRHYVAPVLIEEVRRDHRLYVG